MTRAIRAGEGGFSHISSQPLDAHLDWVRSVVGTLIKRMDIPSDEFDELVSAGYLGLVEAADRFDASRGVTFEAYAQLRVRGSIIDAIRKNCDLSARGYRYAKALQAATDLRLNTQESEEQEKKSPSIARALDYVAKGAIAFRLSLDDAGSDYELQSSDASAEEALAGKQEKQILRQCVKILPELERQVVELYYFQNQTVHQIADKLGVTKGWVSKVHKKALGKLQSSLSLHLDR
ncbi:MAG: sigma-70 family RNA polymerase sigma factor [Bdellovibrionales bacterium]|nr:sigma-70 family RNA polymerase sigma factor [Bdellovibrionales bacterium]